MRETLQTRVNSPEYSFSWAQSVVSAAYEKHARGWQAVEQLFGVTARNAAFFLAKNDPMWKYLRDRAKFLDAKALLNLDNLTYDQWFSWERWIIAHHAPETLRTRLDRRLEERAIVMEQGFSAEGGLRKRVPFFERDSASYAENPLQLELAFG